MNPQQIMSIVMFVINAGIVLLFALCVEYKPDTALDAQYSMFQDVHIMIFAGFGFLMAFLHRNAQTTLGHSFLVASFVVLWTILNHGFWTIAVGHMPRQWHAVHMNLKSLVSADYAAGAVLISFGAVVGRISAFQLLIMAFWEVVVYNINESILVERYAAADIGGSMVIHTFGAYFGLACSFVWDKMNKAAQEKSMADNKSTQTSDTFAMVGTLFLWCFWPSFNAALAGDASGVTVINTYLSLTGSCLGAAYVMVLLYGGKFRMVEVQNSTLAGGVAIGTCANMIIHPYSAIIIGLIAGIVSVGGYKFLSPALEKIGLRDTCGIHNLHGMPGIIGAIAGIIAAAAVKKSAYADHGIAFSSVFVTERSGGSLAAYQIYSLLTTLGLALIGGAIAGIILSLLPVLDIPAFYTDECEWVELEEAGESAHAKDSKGASGIMNCPIQTITADQNTTEPGQT